MGCWQSSLSLALADAPAASCQLEGDKADLQLQSIHQKMFTLPAKQATTKGWCCCDAKHPLYVPSALAGVMAAYRMLEAALQGAGYTGSGHVSDDGVPTEINYLQQRLWPKLSCTVLIRSPPPDQLMSGCSKLECRPALDPAACL